MRFSLLSLVSLALVTTHVSAVSPGFPYGSQKVRGVNLGGWLVLEPWITPTLFDQTGDKRIIDEWTFGQYQDKGKALTTLKKHWDTWITEQDFADIAAAGLNHVRLPIGYWAFESGLAPGDQYVSGQLPYLKKAVEWAKKHNLKLIVDLHGAPGSQNGFDNSGQKKDYPQWHTNPLYVERTNQVVEEIADMFYDQPSDVPIIAPLNEPAGFYGDDVRQVTRQYWLDSYDSVRYPCASDKESDTLLLIHDAFQPLSYWNDFMKPGDYEGVAMDTHIYSIFSDDLNRQSLAQHIQGICNRQQELSSFHLWVIVGEFTPAYTDCAKYLNGRGVGSRYDGTYPGSKKIGSCEGMTGKASTFSNEYKDTLRKFWEAQIVTYEKAAGWVQWTWKTEAEEWSYKAGIENGWIPKDPTQLKYPNICKTGP